MSGAPIADSSRDVRIVLYDGVCGFCNGSVRWLIERDRAARLCYAPLQGETAQALRARHPEIPTEIETIVFVEAGPGGERVWFQSSAVFRVLRELAAPWRWLAPLRWLLPQALWDVAYRGFARRRYRWFGRLEACPIPPAAWRERFLC
jgi:predicted DCC family thiol-disulfide oxidoreductase YuxK